MTHTGNPSRSWYSGYRGVGTVVYDIVAKKATATVQKPVLLIGIPSSGACPRP